MSHICPCAHPPTHSRSNVGSFRKALLDGREPHSTVTSHHEGVARTCFPFCFLRPCLHSRVPSGLRSQGADGPPVASRFASPCENHGRTSGAKFLARSCSCGIRFLHRRRKEHGSRCPDPETGSSATDRTQGSSTIPHGPTMTAHSAAPAGNSRALGPDVTPSPLPCSRPPSFRHRPFILSKPRR